MNVKKLLSIFAVTLIFGSAMALDHGSINVKAAQLYAQIDDASGANTSSPIDGLTVDFKLVTIGTTTWAWTELYGDFHLMGESWSSQLRWWTPTSNSNSLSGRVSGTQQSYGVITNLPVGNPTTFSIFQHTSEGDWIFRETAKTTYNYTTTNSKDPSDTTAPLLADPVINNQSAVSIELTLSATDNSDDFFYYIVDDYNAYEEVSFFNTINIVLEPETDYNFSIQAIDFSGNVSETKIVSITGTAFECNNLLSDKTIALKEVKFTPNWVASENYTASVTNNILTAHLGDATTSQWQAQFWVSIYPPLALTAGERYSFLVDVETTDNMQFYAKIADDDEYNLLGEIPLQVVYGGETNTLAAYDIVCPAELTHVSQILFDFGNSPAADLAISNISVCGPVLSNVLDNNTGIEFSVFQSDKMITIFSQNVLKSVNLYSITGQSIMINMNNNQINTTDLSSGIYILSIVDIYGNEKNSRVIIK